MICANGHEFEQREWLAGAMRCRQCHLESGRRREQRRRDRIKAGKVNPASCPYCSLVPCRCEEL